MDTQEVCRTLKRQRSSSFDNGDGIRPQKFPRQDPQRQSDAPRRPVLPSFSDTDENHLKHLKQDQDSDSLDLGGAKVTNLRYIALDERGNEFQLESTTSAVPGISQYGLPTPDLTPLPKVNPFDKVTISAPASPANFAYVGDLRLFGLIPSKVYVYEHISDVLHPYDEAIKIVQSGQISLGTLWPSLQGSDWDVLTLNDPILGFQEHVTNSGMLERQAGLYLESNIVFQGALQPVSDFLRDFFKQEKPAIRFSTWLGHERRYGEPFSPASFVLRGSLEHVSVNVFNMLTFREIGVELSGNQVYNLVEKKTKWSFGYGFFGKLDLSIPGTVVPLQVDYYLRRSLHSWLLQIRLKDDEWNDLFGVKGLKLTDVSLLARLDSGSTEDRKLTVGIEANLELRKTTFGVRGMLSKDFYSVEAYLGELTLHDVGEIFHELVGIELDIFSHDVLFRSMSLCVSSNGLELRGEVTINGHTSTSGGLKFTRDGVAVHGSIGDIEFEQVIIKGASLDVFIASKLNTDCARASKIDIFGDVCIHGVEVKAALHTEKAEDGEFRWTIYGEVEGDVTTSKIVPDLKDTFLDISLNRLALIASNHNAPSGSYKGINYPVAKGFQFCASIDSIPELEQLMRGSVKGMVLRAALTEGQFAISIILPAARTISFSDTVYSGPLEIEVLLGTNIALVLKAILNVKVDTQPDPLQFSIGLKADRIAASAYAQMLNDWTNPCNIGKNVVIRKCALEFGIVYTTFFTTGTPGAIGLAGELRVGSKLAAIAMKVSQNPSEQLLSAQITDLGVVDLVKFASLVAEEDFPLPDDFIHFNNVELYLSTGATVGLTSYPPGASLKGDMTLFGKRAQFECTVGKKVRLMATIEHFELGPLTVKGATRPDPIVDIELSADKQHILIDGAVEIWGASAALHFEAVLYPHAMLDFGVDLRLSDLFMLKLMAKLSGGINIKDIKTWKNADFEVYGLMEQHLIDHVVEQLDQQIKTAREAAKHGFDDVRKAMDEKEAAFKAECQVAIDEVEAARAKWLEKKASIDASFESAHAEATRIRKELQDKVDEAERSFKGLIAEKTARLEQMRCNGAAAIDEAQQKIDDAQRESDDAIREAQDDLQRAKQDFEDGFGSAERDLEGARHDVENAQRTVDDLDRDIASLDRQIDDEPWYNCPPLVAEKASLVAAQIGATVGLQTVRGIFYAAEGVVHGTGFVAAEGAIGLAQTALDGVREVKTDVLNGCKEGLNEVRDLQNAIIQSAIDALHAAEHASNELHVFDFARDALNAGESVAQSMISGAQDAVDGLARCGEFIAFDAAEAALRFAQANTSELNLARHAVEVAEGAVNMGLDVAQWAVDHAGKLFNITKVEFSGSVRSLVHAEEGGPPLTATVEGLVLGHEIIVHIVWKPDFDLVRFIKELFQMLWEKMKEFAKQVV